MIILCDTKLALLTAALSLSLACTDDTDAEADHALGDGDTDTDTAPPLDGESDGEGDGDTDSTGDPTGDGDGGDTDTDPTGDDVCGELSCEDALILDLSLQEKVAEAVVESVQDGDDWISSVDASAGGTMAAPTNPWVYMRFTDTGLEKLEIDDYAALSSGAWHIAAKRFGIRVNSGSSGPGCIEIAAVEGTYAEIDAVPDMGAYTIESFYDDQCALIEDGSGLPGNPAYAMASWWGYAGCVTTSGQVFVLSLDDGTALKLVVDAYYAEGQDTCNQTGVMGSGSAEMSWRWRVL